MQKPNSTKPKETITLYYRRCHVCGHICDREDTNHIEACEKCGKHWAKFHYFDDRLTPVDSDRNLRTPPRDGEWTPIHGLTVYWESF